MNAKGEAVLNHSVRYTAFNRPSKHYTWPVIQKRWFTRHVIDLKWFFCYLSDSLLSRFEISKWYYWPHNRLFHLICQKLHLICFHYTLSDSHIDQVRLNIVSTPRLHYNAVSVGDKKLHQFLQGVENTHTYCTILLIPVRRLFCIYDFDVQVLPYIKLRCGFATTRVPCQSLDHNCV